MMAAVTGRDGRLTTDRPRLLSAARKIVFADAFAGCGGLSLGLLQAGLQGSFAIEHDKFAFETLRTNLLSENAKFRFKWPRWFPQKPIDVGNFLKSYNRELQALEGQIDVLVGGPPCQGFSCAGRRMHDDPRNQLFHAYLSVVDVLRPKAVLIENVRGFTVDFEAKGSVQNYSRKLREKLAEDYEVFEGLLDLSEFGVPQARTRYFLLALKPGLCSCNPFDQLKARLPSFLRALRLRAPVSSWAAISDLEISVGGRRPSAETKGFDEIKYTKPRTHFQRLMADGEAAPSLTKGGPPALPGRQQWFDNSGRPSGNSEREPPSARTGESQWTSIRV